MIFKTFQYAKAFERNLGWLTDNEQEELRGACVGIAGLGGAGGFQAQALARLGVGRFKIADPDTFELSNINRQIGATVQTLGHSKIEVAKNMILGINPEAQVETIKEPITANTVYSFLEGVDLAIDGIDFFAQKAKLLFFKHCYDLAIPALTCAPLGFGSSVINFSPKGMRYEDYFDVTDAMDEKELRTSVTFGLSPTPLCMKYMDARAINFSGERAASVAPGLMLVAAVSATEAVKILTGKMNVHYCPHVYQIDLMTQKVVKRYYPFGMKSPLQRLKKKLALTLIQKHATQTTDENGKHGLREAA